MTRKLNHLQIKARKEVLEKIKKTDASLSLLFEMHFLDTESEFPSESAKNKEIFLNGVFFTLVKLHKVDREDYKKLFLKDDYTC